MNNYEKKYKETLGTARYWHSNSEGDIPAVLEEIFPELKESEDERIRGAIMHFISHTPTVPKGIINKEQMLAWLEKQGERESDIRYKYLDELLIADDIYQMSMNEAMTNEAKIKAVNALSNLCISKLLGLEKQGQKVPVIDFKAKDWYVSKVDGKIHNIYYSVDKVQPKFKVGDWVVHDISDGRKVIRQIINMTNKSYILDGEDFNTFYFNDLENDYHLWTIQDAKDGDVLACENGWTCIFNCLHDNLFDSYCFMDAEGWFCEYGGKAHTLDNRICGEIHPATKEQRDILFQKMKESGYKWNPEKKELNLLITNGGDFFESENCEQKPSWSEEDEDDLNNIIWLCNNCINGSEITWIPSQAIRIKSLIERIKDTIFLQSKQEWSEEDEYLLDETIKHLEELIRIDKAKHCACDVQYYQRDIDWLKLLKDRVHIQSKSEWNKEDEEMVEGLNSCLDELEEKNGWNYVYVNSKNVKLNKVRNWVKSLKQRIGG